MSERPTPWNKVGERRRLSDLLGKYSDDFEAFEEIVEYAGQQGLSESEAMLVRLYTLASVAAIEGAERERINGADSLDIIIHAVDAAAMAAATLAVQGFTEAGLRGRARRELKARLTKSFDRMVDLCLRKAEGPADGE